MTDPATPDPEAPWEAPEWARKSQEIREDPPRWTRWRRRRPQRTDPAIPGTFYILVCLDCGDGETLSPLVFETPAERGGWAAAHTRGTGHQRWIIKDQPRTRRETS
jgi:hypothetical protein